ncbi:hypothetical protein [Qingshengfaniella alkalisoli]|uniref:Uncharacterized protein n=1 Tax=Qingshengfaniella alkalisoli TaxID=2599296 RepID=A0A5B8IUK9_9RHOB|nr:hypothetical protein [Qingshengfaniella alkalisoli]QDY69113.1 hypothetical protein FPZ52_05345 [Qingshengfaniella alkalisoli]
MAVTDTRHRFNRPTRVLFAIPVLGWILRDVMAGDDSNIYYALAAFLCGWLCAIILFGYPAIIIPALMLVPTMFALLVTITFG